MRVEVWQYPASSVGWFITCDGMQTGHAYFKTEEEARAAAVVTFGYVSE